MVLRRNLPLIGLAAVLGTAGALSLSGCTPAPLPYAESVTHYDAVMTDVVTALEESFPGVTWTFDGEPGPDTDAGACVLRVPTRESATSLVEESGGWDAVGDTLDPVLSEHGFEALAERDVPGGWTAQSSDDDHGARLQVSDKGASTITLWAPLDAVACN